MRRIKSADPQRLDPEDETGCIYVSGKIPAGVSTLDPKGESLMVSGVMKIRKGGKPYFQAKEITRK